MCFFRYAVSFSTYLRTVVLQGSSPCLGSDHPAPGQNDGMLIRTQRGRIGSDSWHLCRSLRLYPENPHGPSKAERRQKRESGLSWCRRCRDWKPSKQIHSGLCRPHSNEEARRLYATSRRFRLARRQHAHSRKRGVAPIPPEAQEMLLEEFDGKCAYCMNPATTWDHVIPVTRGGQTTPSNVVPACSSCNSSTKSKDVFEWLEATGRRPSHQLFDRIILAECGFNP